MFAGQITTTNQIPYHHWTTGLSRRRQWLGVNQTVHILCDSKHLAILFYFALLRRKPLFFKMRVLNNI